MPAKSKYKQTYPKRLVEFGRAGLSVPQVASRFGVSAKTFYEWAKDPSKPRFMAAVDRYYTELYAYFNNLMQKIEQGESKATGLGAAIYRIRITLSNKFPEVLIDLKKEIVTEQKATPAQVKDELKKLLSNNFNLLDFISPTKRDDDPEPRSVS